MLLFPPLSFSTPSLLTPPPPRPRLLLPSFRLVSLVIQCERSGGYQSHHCLTVRLQNPGPPSVRQPQSSYLRGPSGKPHTLEEKYLICPLCKDQQSHKRQERPGVAKEGGGGRKRKWEDRRWEAGGRVGEEGYHEGAKSWQENTPPFDFMKCQT